MSPGAVRPPPPSDATAGSARATPRCMWLSRRLEHCNTAFFVNYSRVLTASDVQFVVLRTRVRRPETEHLRHPITRVFTRATPSAIIYSMARTANTSTYDLYSSMSKVSRPGKFRATNLAGD